MTTPPNNPGSGSDPPIKAAPPVSPSTPIETQTTESYIASELQRARASLKFTMIGGLAAVLLVGGYLLYVTSHFVEQMRPHVAAEIAEGVINQQVEAKGPELADQLKQKIPEYIAQTPDYALEQLPKYRVAAEDRVEGEMTKYCQNTSDQLGHHLDTYLDQHKDEIKGLLTSGNDPATVKAVGTSLNQELMSYLREKPQNGEALGVQIDHALASLQEVQKKMHRLAVEKNLTAQEKNTRRAIAILSTSIDKPGVIPKLPANLLPGSNGGQ